MEKWQCQQSSNFCETLKNKNPTDLQHWQREHSKYFTECCWLKDDKNLKDYDKEVKIKSKDVFKKGIQNGEYNEREDINNKWTAHYRMIIPLKSQGNVIIKMTFEMSVIDGGVTDQDIEVTKRLVLDINKIWNRTFTLKVTDTRNPCCDAIKLPIKFNIQFAYKGEKIANGEKHPHKIELYND